MTQEELKMELEELAVRFSEGWHKGIKIDASDIMLLNEAAQALAQRKPLNWEPIQEFWRNNSNIDWDELESAIKQAAHGIKENT